MNNINEENKKTPDLVRHPQEENPTPQSDTFAHKKDEENPRPDEKENVEEENQIRSKDGHEAESASRKQYNPQKVSNVSHAVSAGITTIAVVLVVASVFILGQDFFKKAPTYEVNDMTYRDDATGNGIVYDLTVKTNPDNIPLLLKSSYTDEFGRTKDSSSVDITATKTYTGMMPMMKYYGASYVVRIVRTDHNSEKTLWESSSKFSRIKETKFYGFYWDCHCTDTVEQAGEAAGKAYYQLTYVDDFAYWSNFHVRLTKVKDTSVTYDFACETPYSDRHLIETASKEGGQYTADILASSTEIGTTPKEETIYSLKVDI
jgi:hypothetical protein